MIFVARRTSVDLNLSKPLDCCCNCGGDAVDLVETPMRRTRFYFVFGTELTVRESFPYCAACRRSATRARSGPFETALLVALATAVALLVLAAVETSLPEAMRAKPVRWSLLAGLAITFGWRTLRRRPSERSYYQPVSLARVTQSSRSIDSVELRFTNARYAALVRAANPELVAVGRLVVSSAA